MKFDIHVVFAGGREIKTFTTVFRDLGKYILGKRYFQHLMYCERRMSWLLLLFDKHFSNNLQISSKYRNTMLSFCKISLKKYNTLEADENGRMFFLHNEFLLYIFKCQMHME